MLGRGLSSSRNQLLQSFRRFLMFSHVLFVGAALLGAVGLTAYAWAAFGLCERH